MSHNTKFQKMQQNITTEDTQHLTKHNSMYENTQKRKPQPDFRLQEKVVFLFKTCYLQPDATQVN